MRKLLDNEKELISQILSKSKIEFKICTDISEMYVVDLDDGGMGSIEFCNGQGSRDFGTAILNAIAYDVDNRKVMIEISIDSEGYLYQLDAFTEDYLPLKASLGTSLKITDFSSPPIYE
ncbi:hypothetical protein SKM54_12300 [Acinetobacter faecalis]|uniref:DUF6984 family protein n=1 Tax=Acinetobacter faecalis TaxID=2665161 RepID=UPI002A91A059|nr:hypothetical protein [Acinetobacter faecalis]MDY6451643.1 hypothetical protein [Acinetobacter faecalis]MDY6483214.1 hypothetical protein [Acinetobacter faecalis]